VFNAGPRLCLGKPLAYLEVKIAAVMQPAVTLALTLTLKQVKMVTVMLLRRFHFAEVGGPHDGSYQTTLTLPMKGGFKVKATPV
jgi:cytochrome P450